MKDCPNLALVAHQSLRDGVDLWAGGQSEGKMTSPQHRIAYGVEDEQLRNSRRTYSLISRQRNWPPDTISSRVGSVCKSSTYRIPAAWRRPTLA
jgi:hypothetical protein